MRDSCGLIVEGRKKGNVFLLGSTNVGGIR
jgi:hypothetical protein